MTVPEGLNTTLSGFQKLKNDYL